MANSPESLVSRATQISTLPVIFYRINEALANPESSLTEIAHILAGDPALSARLLKIVNSSFYGFPSKIETINHAITIIGTAQLRDLVLATTVVSRFNGISKNAIDLESFWRHSIGCGLAARTLATMRHEANSDRFYIMGLLHDIGRLVICLNLSDIAAKITETAKSEKQLLYAVERNVLGFDHADVGGALLKAWKLPPRLQEGVAGHHGVPESSAHSIDGAIVHVADIIASAMQLGVGEETFVPPLRPKAWDMIRISTSELPAIMEMVDLQFNDAVEMFLGD